MSELYGLFEFLQGIGLLALVIMLPIFIIGGTIGHFSYRDPQKMCKRTAKAKRISAHPEYQRAFKKASELQQVFLDAKEIDDGYFTVQDVRIMPISDIIADRPNGYYGSGYLFFAKYYDEPFILMEVEKYLAACANGNSAMREAYHNSLGTHLFGSLENMRRVKEITGYDFDHIVSYFRQGKEWDLHSYKAALDLPLYCGEFFRSQTAMEILQKDLAALRINPSSKMEEATSSKKAKKTKEPHTRKANKYSANPDYQFELKRASELQQIFQAVEDSGVGKFKVSTTPLFRDANLQRYYGKEVLYFTQYYEGAGLHFELERYRGIRKAYVEAVQLMAYGSAEEKQSVGDIEELKNQYESRADMLGVTLFRSLENWKRMEEITHFEMIDILDYLRPDPRSLGKESFVLDLPLFCGKFLSKEFYDDNNVIPALLTDLKELSDSSSKKDDHPRNKATATQGKDASKSTQGRTKHTKFEPYIMRYLRHLRK